MNENELAVATAPEQAPTAAPEPETDISSPEPTPADAPKTFSQEELDAAIGKRLAREQRKWEREQANGSAETQIVKAAPTASVDQFESPEAYAEALAYQKAEELIAKREAAKQQSPKQPHGQPRGQPRRCRGSSLAGQPPGQAVVSVVRGGSL